MKEQTQALEHASVKQYCKALRVPMIGAHFVQLAEQAIKEQRSHIGYLEALLTMESEERDRHAIQQRLRDAKLPRLKTLEEFDFNQARQIPAAKIRELAEGGYIERAEPVVLMGECGTGKTHLATGLCVAACRQKRRARFTTAANLVNELVEARQHNAVKRVLTRWLRYDVIVLDEVGYVPLADIGAEFLFQVIAERAERASLIVTTNLPFSEWTQVFPNPRLCKALLDRITESSAHHRNRRRVLPLSQNPGGAAEKESIVGGCFYSAGQGKELKRRSFPCTPSWLEPQDQAAILINTGGANCEYQGGAKSGCQKQQGKSWRSSVSTTITNVRTARWRTGRQRPSRNCTDSAKKKLVHRWGETRVVSGESDC